MQQEAYMQQPRGRIFDDLGKLVSDAAGMAQGVRREVETIVKTQIERLLASMDVVQREEFEAVRDLAAAAREENESLKARIAALEQKLGI
jgi:BMFP domain-containing protein YqiC